MHVPHALPTLRVSNGEDAYAFVGMVSFGAKSSGACRRRSTRRFTADVEVEVDAGAIAAVAVGPEKSGTGRWRWWMFGFGSTCRVEVCVAVGAVDRRVARGSGVAAGAGLFKLRVAFVVSVPMFLAFPRPALLLFFERGKIDDSLSELESPSAPMPSPRDAGASSVFAASSGTGGAKSLPPSSSWREGPDMFSCSSSS